MIEVSREYSSALFDLAKEQKSEKSFYDALCTIRDLFEAMPEYIDVLSSPDIPANEKEGLIDSAFGSFAHEYVLSFLKLLCKNGHLKNYRDCVKEYEELYRSYERKSDVRIVSAVKLTDSEKNMLVKKLEHISGHSITAKYETDDSIIGGIVVYMDDKIIDGSLRHKLKDVKDVIGK